MNIMVVLTILNVLVNGTAVALSFIVGFDGASALSAGVVGFGLGHLASLAGFFK